MLGTGPLNPEQGDPLERVEALGRETYGDDFERFLATPRRSLGLETPAALFERSGFTDSTVTIPTSEAQP